MTLDDIIDGFELLDDWEERYRFLIELGRSLAPLSDSERTPASKVDGCVSQVWLVTERGAGQDPVLTFRGDSDAHLVRGLVAVVFALYSGKRASEILAIDPMPVMDRLGLATHLTPQRSNGLKAMLNRIRTEAAIASGSA